MRIIFFDEIDGLAPVRSSKQDQIHASIVSTLLALMDGLDDRDQRNATTGGHGKKRKQDKGQAHLGAPFVCLLEWRERFH